MNGAYGLLISGLVGSSDNGSWSSWFLIGFSLFVSFLVVFKSVMALLYICYWKGKTCWECCGRCFCRKKRSKSLLMMEKRKT